MQKQFRPGSHCPRQDCNCFKLNVLPPAGKDMSNGGFVHATNLGQISLAPTLLLNDLKESVDEFGQHVVFKLGRNLPPSLCRHWSDRSFGARRGCFFLRTCHHTKLAFEMLFLISVGAHLSCNPEALKAASQRLRSSATESDLTPVFDLCAFAPNVVRTRASYPTNRPNKRRSYGGGLKRTSMKGGVGPFSSRISPYACTSRWGQSAVTTMYFPPTI
jgi:hypothetical protein